MQILDTTVAINDFSERMENTCNMMCNSLSFVVLRIYCDFRIKVTF